MADNRKNDLFHKDEFGELITSKENIIDYIECTHFVQINDKENREILQTYGLDKNGSWHNGYFCNYAPGFLSRWQLSDWEIEEASDGQLLEHIKLTKEIYDH